MQTKGELITCINHCHLLELTLLCQMELWNWTSLFPILRVSGAFIFILFLIDIHVPVCKEWKSWSYVAFLGVWSGPALFAYVHFYRTLCTSRLWSYYCTFMRRLSNVREILQFHYCNVTLYTEKETVPQGQNRAACFVTTALFFNSYFIYIFFLNTIKCLGSGHKPR